MISFKMKFPEALIATITIFVFLVKFSEGIALSRAKCTGTAEVAPVCGTDNKMYKNYSWLKCAALNQPGLEMKWPDNCKPRRSIRNNWNSVLWYIFNHDGESKERKRHNQRDTKINKTKHLGQKVKHGSRKKRF